MELGDGDKDLYRSHWHVAPARDATRTEKGAQLLVPLGRPLGRRLAMANVLL
jgi:hypothetical protein